jgi:hypothetical protein
MFAAPDRPSSKITGAKDTDFLPQEIAARYNAITATPESP